MADLPAVEAWGFITVKLTGLLYLPHYFTNKTWQALWKKIEKLKPGNIAQYNCWFGTLLTEPPLPRPEPDLSWAAQQCTTLFYWRGLKAKRLRIFCQICRSLCQSWKCVFCPLRAWDMLWCCWGVPLACALGQAVSPAILCPVLPAFLGPGPPRLSLLPQWIPWEDVVPLSWKEEENVSFSPSVF